jgi:curli production assembly/transport component CsgG
MKRMFSTIITTLMLYPFVFVSGCGDINPSINTTRATIGYTTAIHDDLISLPPPNEKIVIAVYKFRDQTGQYKTSAQVTTFSTAVTQGATSMLNKVLEDSGWFVPIEREGLANLLNERKIIRSTRMQYEAEGDQKLTALPPLLYAGVLLEGGIIGYDTNLITGGFGAKYFGAGGYGELRKDKVTIYLRLTSVKNGAVLKSVSTTKSILSREVDFGIYRFVSIKRLLEVETGLSTNEPPSICVLEAIEKAVYDLIIEGILDGIWELKNPEDINSAAIQNYLKEREKAGEIATFNNEGNLVEIKDDEQPEDIEESEPETVEDIKKLDWSPKVLR